MNFLRGPIDTRCQAGFWTVTTGLFIMDLSLTDLSPILSAVAPPWYTQIRGLQHISWVFRCQKTTTKWKKLTTWQSWAHSPQIFWHLKIDHHQPIRELCTSGSHILGCPSLTWPLKRFCWNLSRNSGFFWAQVVSSPCWALQQNFLCSKRQSFYIVGPHCA